MEIVTHALPIKESITFSNLSIRCTIYVQFVPSNDLIQSVIQKNNKNNNRNNRNHNYNKNGQDNDEEEIDHDQHEDAGDDDVNTNVKAQLPCTSNSLYYWTRTTRFEDSYVARVTTERH